jgi:RNA polymerase sigma factor (sigma-70 family)
VTTDAPDRLAGLLERARGGDRQAWTQLHAEINPRLWHVARAQGLNRDEAFDAVQVAWLELVRHLDSLRSPRALTAWLVTTTKREAWRIANRRAHGPDLSTVEVVDDRPTPDRLAELAERDRLLWDNVARLPVRCQQLLRLLALQTRPDYAQVTEQLGMPKGSIGPTRGRCLALLRTHLGADPRWSDT